MNKVILLILLLVISLTIAGPISPMPTPISPTPISPTPTYTVLPLFVAILIAVGIAIIVFLISRIAHSPNLEAWSKHEMSEIFSTILIAFILIALIFTVDMVPALTGYEDTNYKDKTLEYLEIQRNDARNLFFTLSNTNFVLTKYSAFSYSKTTSIPLVDWLVTDFESRSQNFGLGPLVSKFSKSFDSLGQAIFIISAEKILLQYLLYVIPLFFFPLGIILRALPFTRKFGTILLALCIAGYFIFPLSVVFSGEIYKSIMARDVMLDKISIISDTTRDIDPGDIPYQGYICSPLSSAIAMLGQFGFIITSCAAVCAITLLFGGFAACYAICKPIAELVYYVAVPFYQYVYGDRLGSYAVMNEEIFGTTYDLIIETILPFVTLHWLLSIILPLITIILTVVSIRSISSALGADIQIYGLSRLI